MYLEREKSLGITAPESELEERLKGGCEEKIEQFQTILNSLVAENMDLKKRVSEIEDLEPSIKRSLIGIRISRRKSNWRGRARRFIHIHLKGGENNGRGR